MNNPNYDLPSSCGVVVINLTTGQNIPMSEQDYQDYLDSLNNQN